MKRFLNVRTIRFFLLCFLCLFFISGSLATGSYLDETANERKNYQASLTEETQRISKYFTSSFSAAVSACNAIFFSRWYTHFRNSADIYREEFDPLRRSEIQQELVSKMVTMEFVSDILIVTPHQNSVIGKNGWFTIKEYTKYFPALDIAEDGTAGGLAVSASDPAYCTVTLEDVNIRRDKGIICILLDKKLIGSVMEQLCPEQALGVRAQLEGQAIYEQGILAGGPGISLEQRSASISSPAFSLEITYPRYEDSLLMARRANYFLLLSVSLLASILLAAVITFISSKPLHQILMRLGAGSCHYSDDPYRLLTDYVESFSAQNERLNQENSSLNASMERFLAMMKNEILFGMLTNPDFDFFNEYVCSYIPWINEGLSYILAILEPIEPEESGSPAERLTEAGGTAEHIYSFTILHNDVCALFWYTDPAGAKEAAEGLSSRIGKLFGETHYCAVSEALREPEEMRGGYLVLKEEIDNRRKAVQELPITLQIKLISKLQANKPEDCAALMTEYQDTCAMESFLSLLARIALEYGFDASQAERAYRAEKEGAARWDVILRLSGDLCKAINCSRKAGIGESAQVIRAYIEDHSCDPELCVKQLADHFSMHRTLISKIFKSQTGISFSDYLLELRMKKSQELLRGTEQSITAIAEAVGYGNYTTFKRAFIRYQGITPREYRAEQASGSSLET